MLFFPALFALCILWVFVFVESFWAGWAWAVIKPALSTSAAAKAIIFFMIECFINSNLNADDEEKMKVKKAVL